MSLNRKIEEIDEWIDKGLLYGLSIVTFILGLMQVLIWVIVGESKTDLWIICICNFLLPTLSIIWQLIKITYKI